MSDDSAAAAARRNYIDGLKTERAMYVAANRTDRVAQVDAELARFGEAPKRRRAVKKDTA